MKTRLIPLISPIISLLLALPAFAVDVTISSLPSISTVTANTVVPVVDVSGTATTKKATVAQLVSGLPASSSTVTGTMSAADKLKLDSATSNNTVSTLVARDSSGNFSAGTVTANIITGLAAPVNGSDAANKTYVDAAAAGLIIKDPVVAATTVAGGNITLSGGAPNTLDGVTLSLNNRILVKDQTDNTQNGIYYVSTLGTGSNGTWTRTTDADTGGELVTGSYVFISGGTVNANAGYVMGTQGTITIGVSPIVWNLFSQVTQILASNILGQITQSQIADAAISTAKFASTIQPVGLVSSLPSPVGYTGPNAVFNTGDSKLYRYNGVAFIATIPASDLSTQITAGQLAAGSVTAGTVAANAITAGTIAAGAVSATEIATNAITSDKIYANAVTADKIVSNAITSAKIQAGAVTTDKITAATLSAITANLGTVTAGSLTANTTVTVGTGATQVAIDATNGLTVGSRISFKEISGNPAIKVSGTGTYASSSVVINGSNNAAPAYFSFTDASGIESILMTGTGGVAVKNNTNITLSGNADLVFNSGSEIQGTVTVAAGATVTFNATSALNLNQAELRAKDSGGSTSVDITGDGGLWVGNSKSLQLKSGSSLVGPGKIDINPDNASTRAEVNARETGAVGTQIGYMGIWLNGRQVLIPIYNTP